MSLVLNYLEKTTENFKDKVAVICEDEKVTYQELLNDSKLIGSNLGTEIKITEPVAVYMEKGIKTLETFFGILYAGGCYSLINTEFPEKRINEIINTLEANIIVTDKEHYESITSYVKDKKIVLVDDLLNGSINEDLLETIRSKKIDLDPVYINFTSGSTGVPKGVCVGNRSIIDFIDEFTSTFEITSEDIIANQAPFDFDVSVKDIYSAIKVGATLVLVPKKYFSSPVNLLDYLCDHKITTMTWAVSALCLVTTFHALDYKTPETVNKIIFSGEVMPIKHLKEWIKHLPNCKFINVYGPTEITCNCTYYVVDNNKEYDALPIGKAFNNERVFLLDENDNEVTEKDVSGEICIAGSCLALGYYNNKVQTDEHFTRNPLNKKYIEYIYRTGDLGKYMDDGNLIFSGRKDFQIKYMGHRIELEEIDRAISKIEGIKRVVTLFYEKKSKLYCFYIGDLTKEEIVEKLKVDVPEYMIPSIFRQVDDFVLNKNGKIDRKVLMESIEAKK